MFLTVFHCFSRLLAQERIAPVALRSIALLYLRNCLFYRMPYYETYRTDDKKYVSCFYSCKKAIFCKILMLDGFFLSDFR